MDKLKQIAAEVGVSKNTVLRVLRGENKEIWPSAIKRAEEIRGLASRLGYLPNGSARAMRRGSFNTISLVLSTNEGRSYLPSDLFNEIHDSLNERGFRLIVSKLKDEELNDQKAVPSILRDWACDGLLINYTDHIPRNMVRLLEQYRIPSILMNSRQKHDCVYYDEFGGSMAATQSLIAHGHTRIIYLDFIQRESRDRTHYSRIDRYEGYRQAMETAGLEPTDRYQFAGVPVIQRLEATRAVLAGSDRPTAIISYDSGERVLYAACMAGLVVPRDLSIVTFGPKPPASSPMALGETYFGREIAMVRVPAEQAGKYAVEMLMQKIESPGKKLAPQVVPMEWHGGETCSACPDSNGDGRR